MPSIDDQFQHTPLHRAAWRGHKDEVRFLVVCGEDIEARDNWGHTPLHRIAHPNFEAYVSEKRQVEVGRFLLRAGANVNARDNWEGTPLHLAAEFGHYEMAKLLLEFGADVNAHTDEGRTPLHSTIIPTQVLVAELLLQQGANVNDAQAQIGGAKSHFSHLAPCKCTPLRMLKELSLMERELTAEELQVLEEAGLETDKEAMRQRDTVVKQRRAEMVRLLQRYGGAE